MVDIRYTTVTESIAVTATSGGANANILYTVPNFHDATIEFLHVSNGGSSTDSISIQWYHKEDDTYYTIVNNKSISGNDCLLYTSPSPRDGLLSRMPSSA